MIDESLATTNLLLGILAAVSLLEAVMLVAVLIGAYRLYVQAMQLATAAQQQLGPLAARVDALATTVERVAADVKDVTGRVATNTARVESVVGTAVSLASYGWGGATASVGRRALRLYSVARGLRTAYQTFRGDGRTPRLSGAGR